MDSNKMGSGYFGFNVVGGEGIEFQLLQNRVVEGMMVGAPTNASTQATGTGASDFNVNISAGLIVVGGKKAEYAAQADFDLASAASQIMASGQSIVVSIVAFLSVELGTVNLRTYRGAVATTGAQLPPTKAEIEATLAKGTFWFKLADVTVNRTADQTLTQTYSNIVRPCLVPETVNKL